MGLKNRHIAIGLHALFWIGHLLVRVFISRFHPTDLLNTFWIELAELPIKMGFTYFMIFFLIPRFLKKENYVGLLVWALVGIAAVAMLKRVHDFYFVIPVLDGSGREFTSSFWNISIMVRRLIYVFPTPGFALALYFIWHWFTNYRQNQLLEKEKLQAELNYLKGQIHPHFLFNTLNNLYALTLKNSPEAPDVVLKLSEMLSYMLYEAREATVPLYREIDQIQNYIELEKLRYGNRLDLSFHTSREIKQVRIAPLLLITFVENAFKHGTGGTLENAFVHMILQVKGSELTFEVENSAAPKMAAPTGHSNGIGLQNVKRRLELIYPEKHQLFIEENNEVFRIKLELKVEDHKMEKINPAEKIPAL